MTSAEIDHLNTKDPLGNLQCHDSETIPEEREPLKVTFFPPLYLQRRMWVLNILRREDITSVVDIGCGEGELLSCLAQPAPWLRPPPHSVSSTALPKPPDEIANLHCKHIQGLDISRVDLDNTINGTVPPDESQRQHLRWEPLEVKVWEGGLESFNPEFVDVECIVSTEVIEHLPSSILPSYAPMILGVYHPRLFLLTTPSYTFNARFSPPQTAERAGYRDPTGRTSRIFRHHDHKFEWTVKEFKEWCESAASDWGYKVNIGAVGRALETDPWGREEDCGGATQVAEFTRIEGKELLKMRTKKSAAVMLQSAKAGHILLMTHQHTAHRSSTKSKSLQDISDAVKLQMQHLQEALMRFEELWFEENISVLCGGWIELLVDAIEEDQGLTLSKHDSEKRDKWRVELIGGVQKKQNLWEDTADLGGSLSEDDSADEDCSDLEASWDNGGSEKTHNGRSVVWESASSWAGGEEQSYQKWALDIETDSWENSSSWETSSSWGDTGTEKMSLENSDGKRGLGANHDLEGLASSTTTGSGWGPSVRDL